MKIWLTDKHIYLPWDARVRAARNPPAGGDPVAGGAPVVPGGAGALPPRRRFPFFGEKLPTVGAAGGTAPTPLPPLTDLLPVTGFALGDAYVTDVANRAAAHARAQAENALQQQSQQRLRQRQAAREQTAAQQAAQRQEARLHTEQRARQRALQEWLQEKGDGIHELEGDLALAAAEQLIANLAKLSRDPVDDEATPWDKNLGDAQKIARQLRDSCLEYRNFGCFFERNAVGLISVSDVGGPVFIPYVVSHPGATGAGGALIEEAATFSQRQTGGGKLWLVPNGPESEAAYDALGFEGKYKMTLDPASPNNADRWTLQDGQWRLRKYLTKPLAKVMEDLRQDGS